MRNPTRKLGCALIALGAGALLFWLAISERLGPEESALTMGAGVIGFTLLLASAYFVPATLLAVRGRARLLAGTDVVARWPVGAAAAPDRCWRPDRRLGPVASADEMKAGGMLAALGRDLGQHAAGH